MNQLSENLEVGCFKDSEGIALDDWKIAIPDATMLYKLVKWYHPPLTRAVQNPHWEPISFNPKL
jgi:hypothetical protein